MIQPLAALMDIRNININIKDREYGEVKIGDGGGGFEVKRKGGAGGIWREREGERETTIKRLMSSLWSSQSESSREGRREGEEAELRRVCFLYHCSISAKKDRRKRHESVDWTEKQYRARRRATERSLRGGDTSRGDTCRGRTNTEASQASAGVWVSIHECVCLCVSGLEIRAGGSNGVLHNRKAGSVWATVLRY